MGSGKGEKGAVQRLERQNRRGEFGILHTSPDIQRLRHGIGAFRPDCRRAQDVCSRSRHPDRSYGSRGRRMDRAPHEARLRTDDEGDTSPFRRNKSGVHVRCRFAAEKVPDRHPDALRPRQGLQNRNLPPRSRGCVILRRKIPGFPHNMLAIYLTLRYNAKASRQGVGNAKKLIRRRMLWT